MTVRDEQIEAIRQRNARLSKERLASCYSEITRAYEAESTVNRLVRVIDEQDRTPSDYRVISISEARRLRDFNDTSYHWEHYCQQLGRSITHSERQYIFEELQGIPPTGTAIQAAHPNFDGILTGARQLISEGHNPDILCAPIGMYVPFFQDLALVIDWHSAPTPRLIVPGGPILEIHWSSGLAPLNRFVILDSRKATWKVKLDPHTKGRLTVVIGEPDTPPNAVMFLAQTVAKFEVSDLAGTYSILIEGDPEDNDETH